MKLLPWCWNLHRLVDSLYNLLSTYACTTCSWFSFCLPKSGQAIVWPGGTALMPMYVHIGWSYTSTSKTSGWLGGVFHSGWSRSVLKIMHGWNIITCELNSELLTVQASETCANYKLWMKWPGKLWVLANNWKMWWWKLKSMQSISTINQAPSFIK